MTASHLESAVAPAPDGARGPGGLASVYAVSFLLSACSIVYELLAAQTMSLLAANTVVWLSLVIGTFLAAMGYGSYRSRRLGRKPLWASLFRIELGLTAVGMLIVPLLHLAHTAHSHLVLAGRPAQAGALFFGTAAAVVVLVGVLTGIELPLLMRIGREIRDESGVANTVLGLDYVGALVGAVAFPLLLLPSLDLVAIGLAVAAVNAAVAGYVLLTKLRKGRWIEEVALAGLALALLVGALNLASVRQYFLRRYYYYLEIEDTWAGRFAPRPEFPEVLRLRSPYQKIDLMLDIAPDFGARIMSAYSTKLAEDPEYPVDRILCLNGDFQTNTRYDEIYHEWFAHVPVALTGKVPRHVLLLGGGDGFLLREILKYDGVERVTHVDIDRVLVDLARTHPVLRHANRDSFRDPRVTTTIGDGYQHVRTTEERYDAIWIDFPVANTYDLAKLYSREFFHFVRKRIAPGGFAVFDSTGTSYLTSWGEDGSRWPAPENDWPIYYHTLRKAGFPTIVPFVATLERDNERAAEILGEFDLGPDLDDGLRAIADPGERERRREEIRADVVRQLIQAHIVAVEQGFVLVAPEAREFTYEYRDPGVPLRVLNEDRFRLAFAVEFPQPEAIDESRVNSILRPTFPTTPWWRPRLPF